MISHLFFDQESRKFFMKIFKNKQSKKKKENRISLLFAVLERDRFILLNGETNELSFYNLTLFLFSFPQQNKTKQNKTKQNDDEK